MTSSGPATELAPPAFLHIAGHPLRWRLLTELGRSDRRVQELTDLVGEPQNLVSYHLGKLRRVGLVSARKSSADGRDSYYTADLARVRSCLAATGAALHPGLRLSAPPLETGQPGPARARVLFLCTGNSARSQMAEALVSHRSGGLVEARSAGSHPKAVHRHAVRVMRDEYGIDLAGPSKHLSTFVDERFDQVITLCDRVREVCPEFPGQPEATHWSMPDPAAGHDDDEATYPAFRQAAAELDTRIGFLLTALINRAEPTSARPKEQP
jgi:protein-tyrosine-phosphatase